jgi:hypothetical protein
LWNKEGVNWKKEVLDVTADNIYQVATKENGSSRFKLNKMDR